MTINLSIARSERFGEEETEELLKLHDELYLALIKDKPDTVAMQVCDLLEIERELTLRENQ
jgi:hypothetical protein